MANDQETLEYLEWRKNPFKFIKAMWGLIPTNKDDKFVKGVHLTWQQTLIVKAVMDAVNDVKPRKITVASGHGIGKTAVFSMLLLRYLFCYIDAQVACTAPTQSQMYDVLWKEIAVWINRMPERAQEMYELSADFVKMVERPKTRWARARTARKESPEAIAGIHGEYVMIMVDEASAVPDEVYITAKGALTNRNMLMLMISNPTRLGGYFYKSHTSLAEDFQTFSFSSIDSPIVDYGFVNDIKKEYGEDSDEYRVRVLGQFPNEDAIDSKGYMRLFRADDIKYLTKVDEDAAFGHDAVLGVDPAGEGSDETVWVLRDNIKAKILKRETISTPKGIAQITSTLMTQYDIPGYRVIIDNFGVGTDCIQELALMGIRVFGLFLGKEANDKKTFLNKRAELYRRTREWLKKGGMFVRQDGFDEVLNIFYRRKEGSNQIQIMPKLEMKRDYGIKSPNCFVSGSQVLTDKGYRNIEDIKVGDIVITPFGNRLVLKNWEEETDEVYILNNKLIGTGNHEIYTNKGFISLEKITNLNTIASDDLFYIIKQRIRWLIQLFSKKKLIGFKKMDTIVQTGKEKNEKEERSYYITQSMKNPFDRFQSDSVYTTLMGILKIIRLKIYKGWNLKNIKDYTYVKDFYQKNIGNRIMTNSIISDIKPLNGINLQNDYLGISLTELIVEQKKKEQKELSQNNVRYVEKNIQPISKDEDFVEQSVHKERDIKGEKCQNLVQIKLKNKIKVYNLTVDKDNVYFCNGYLVSNCADALAFTFLIPGGGMEGGVMSPDFGIDPRKSPVITNNYNV